MAKKRKLGKWIQKLRVGGATVTVHGKTKRAARANASRFIGRHMKNVKIPVAKCNLCSAEFPNRAEAISHFMKQHKSAENSSHRRNISSGFRDAQGRFHPMRYTYTESGGRYRTSDYSQKKADRAAAKAATKRARPMH